MQIVQWCAVCRSHQAEYENVFDEPIGVLYMCAGCNDKLKEASE